MNALRKLHDALDARLTLTEMVCGGISLGYLIVSVAKAL